MNNSLTGFWPVFAVLCWTVWSASAYELAHRWSFNGNNDEVNLVDSVGGVTAEKVGDNNAWSDGKLVMTGNGGRTAGLNLGKNLLSADGATIEIWATHDTVRNWARIFDYACEPTYDGSYAGNYIMWAWSNGTNTDRMFVEVRQGGTKYNPGSVYLRNIMGEPYHFSVTVTKNGTGMTIRYMRRNAVTGAIEWQWSKDFAAGLDTFADAEFLLGGSPYNDSAPTATYEEVRIWNGVLNDEQLTANVIAGPDSLLGCRLASDAAGFDIASGKTFTQCAAMFRTAGTVKLEAGAGIVFDTANFIGTEMKFISGGFILPAEVGSVLDMVTLTDAVNYTATLDGNTITVASAQPAYAKWTAASAPATAADLVNAANWTCYAKDGTTVISGGVPGAATTVIIDGDTDFAIPDGAVPAWKQTRLGGFTATQYGRITPAPNTAYAAYREAELGQYTPKGEQGIDALNASSGTWVTDNLKTSQLRFDGWFYVTAAEAGQWTIQSRFDDFSTLAIDGVWQFINNRWDPTMGAGAYVSEGWHHFTMIAGDTGGGYGSSVIDIGGVKVPFSISINGSSTLTAFHNFIFATGTAGTVTLTKDCDWTALGTLVLTSGTTLDLNGHSLTIQDIAVDYIGSKIVNSAAKKSILYFTRAPIESMVYASGVIEGIDVNIVLAQDGAQVATWTGAANDGNPANAANWEDLAGEAVVPTAAYTARIAGDNVNLQAPAGTDIACKSFEIGNCTFSADCDWRGLSKTPLILGVADFNGFNLKLNHLNADTGCSFVNSAGAEDVSELQFDTVSDSIAGEVSFIDNIGLLTLGDNVKIVITKVGDGTISTGYMNIGDAHYTEFSQNGGAVVLTSDRSVVGGRNNKGHGVYRMDGGNLTANYEFSVGGRGTGEFIQTAGNVTFANWLNIGRNGGTGTLVITGGTILNAPAPGPVFLGAEGGSGTLDASGTADVTLYRLSGGGFSEAGNKGYLNISGDAVVRTTGWGTFGAVKNGYGEINQSGGLFSVGAEFTVGEGGTAIYNLSGGTNTIVGNLYVGRSKDTGRGTYVQGEGTLVTVNDLRIGESAGSIGTYTQNGGTIKPKYWERFGLGGTGTYIQNGGLNDATMSGASSQVHIGESGVATYTLNDGTFNVSGIVNVGESGTGTLHIAGGKMSAQSGITLGTAAAGNGTLFLGNDALLTTTSIKKGPGTATVSFDGGTLAALADSNEFLSGFGSVWFDQGGLTIDSAGHNVAIAGTAVSAFPGSSLTKTGEGTLTADSVPAVGAINVTGGTLAFTAEGNNTATPATLAHRWSFNGDLKDAIGGSEGTSYGSVSYSADNKTVVLAGGTKNTSYIDLGANMLPSDSVTLEFWMTLRQRKVWSKLFCLGKDTSDGIAFTFNRTNDTGVYSLDVNGEGGGTFGMDAMRFETAPYYIAITFTPDGNGGTYARTYCRNLSSDKMVYMVNHTFVNWSVLTRITQNVFWLGHSFWSDYDAYIDIDEVRVWNGTLSEDLLIRSAANGPDASADQIASIEDATYSQLYVASGARVDLGGKKLTQSVVTGSGTVLNGSLVVTDSLSPAGNGAVGTIALTSDTVVTGTINLDVGDLIEVAGGSLDLSGATLKVSDPDNINGAYVFATSQSGAITGKPQCQELKDMGYDVLITADGKRASITRVGTIIIIR